MDNHDPREKLLETLKKFDTVMVVSEGRDGLMHGRPMAVAEVDPSGDLWFVTSRTSEKAREVLADARSLVTGQESGAYVSLSGRMEVVDDRPRVRALWRDTWKIWFPLGKDDPEIVLMRLQAQSGEYWSTSGAAGIRYLFEAAKALISGDRPPVGDQDQHARVRM